MSFNTVRVSSEMFDEIVFRGNLTLTDTQRNPPYTVGSVINVTAPIVNSPDAFGWNREVQGTVISVDPVPDAVNTVRLVIHRLSENYYLCKDTSDER